MNFEISYCENRSYHDKYLPVSPYRRRNMMKIHHTRWIAISQRLNRKKRLKRHPWQKLRFFLEPYISDRLIILRGVLSPVGFNLDRYQNKHSLPPRYSSILYFAKPSLWVEVKVTKAGLHNYCELHRLEKMRHRHTQLACSFLLSFN